jgi:hypothetical protein
VIYDPSRLRGISALAMTSQDLNTTPYSTQPVVRAPTVVALEWRNEVNFALRKLKDQERQLAKQHN